MSLESVIDADYVRSVDARLASYEAYIDYQIQEARRAIPFLSRFTRIQGAKVLEVGTGRGGKGIAYASHGMCVTALDVDQGALEIASQAARTRGEDVRWLAGDGGRLPFASNCYDAVLLDSVVEHVKDPAALLRECARVLKPEGIAFVVFPPYYGPLSGHVDDYVMIPWFHLLPRPWVRRFLLSRRDNKGILTPQEAYGVYATLNGLTVMRFKAIAREAGFQFDYLRVRPFLTHPGMRFAAGMVSAVRHPSRGDTLRNVLGRARQEFDLGAALLFLFLAAIAPLVFVPLLQEIAAGGCKCVLRKPQSGRM